MDTLFKNVTIVTMDDSNRILENAFLGVRDGKISYLDTKPPESETAGEAIDGRGKVIMPGLINCHTHLPMSLLRGYAGGYDLQTWLFDYVFPAEAKMDERAVHCGATICLAEAIRFGTTCFNDMYFKCGAILKAAAEAGVKITVSNGAQMFGEEFDFETDPVCRELVQIHDKWHNYDAGRIKICVGIHAEYTSKYPLWEAMSEYAVNNGLDMHIHLSETKNEHESCAEKYGLTPAQLLDCHGVWSANAVAAHGVWLSDEDIGLLSRRSVSVAHNPVSNAKLASGLAPAPEMLKQGVNVCLGTDGMSSNGNMDLFGEIRAAALYHKLRSLDPMAITPEQALRMATASGAKALGRQGECGELKVGMDADLIMLDFVRPHLQPCMDVQSNLVFSASGSDVALTMVRGKTLYRDGKFMTIDLEQAYREMSTYALPLIYGK